MSSTRSSAAALCARGDDVGDLAHARQLAGGGFSRAIVTRAGFVQVPLRDRQDPRRHRRREQRRLPRRRASPRGSRRYPRRSPCRASRRLRRGPARAGCRAPACRAGCDRARGRASRRRCRRRARARGSAGPSARRRRAARREAGAAARTCASLRRPASPARASAPAPRPRVVAPFAPASLHQTLQHRQRERRGLAGAGRGLPEQIASVEQERNRLALDRRGLFVAERRHGLHQGLVQSESGESGGALSWRDGHGSGYRVSVGLAPATGATHPCTRAARV